MSLYDIGAQIAREYYRMQREQHEWSEDMLTSGLLARMPVSHVEASPLTGAGMALSVVLAGGHVWARREWRYS